MTLYKTEERERVRREKAREAIALAMESRWEEAATVNRSLIQLFPNDVEAYNRLGKALFELGNFAEAKQAFQRALELAPTNAIARKNLRRLAHLRDLPPQQPKKAPRLTPHLFIEESGKTTLTVLTHVAGTDVLARLSAGVPVTLQVQGNTVIAEAGEGTPLGMVEPRLAMRLIRLMGGGNRYEAVITSLADREVEVLVREVYRHPSQQSAVSFTTKETPHASRGKDLVSFEGEEEEEDGAGGETLSPPPDTADEEEVVELGQHASDGEADDKLADEEEEQE